MKKLPPSDNLERYLWCHSNDQDYRSTDSELYILHTKKPMMLMQLLYFEDNNRHLQLTATEICFTGTRLEYDNKTTEQFVIRTIVLFETAPYDELKRVVDGAVDWYLGETDDTLKVSTINV